MHPPSFREEQLLSEWPDCHIEMQCQAYGGRSCTYPVKLLLRRYGDRRFSDVLPRLKCQECGKRPAPVYLCATPHREGGHGGPPPDWALELTPKLLND